MESHCQHPIAQVLREEKERLVKKDQALAAKFKQFQEEIIRLQVLCHVNPISIPFLQHQEDLPQYDQNNHHWVDRQGEREQLGGRGDELDWESCLLSNQLDAS